jgi:hypothetical protein
VIDEIPLCSRDSNVYVRSKADALTAMERLNRPELIKKTAEDLSDSSL